MNEELVFVDHKSQSRLRSLHAIVSPVLLACATVAIAGLPAVLWFQAQSPSVAIPWIVIVAVMAFGSVTVVALVRVAPRGVATIVSLVGRLSSRFPAALLTGLLLRMVSALAIHPHPASDGRIYLGLAEQLVNDHAFGSKGAFAFWPPGLPFALAPLVAAFGAGLTALLVYALLSFVVEAFGMRSLGRAVGLGERATAAVWLVAVWPTQVLCAGLPEKELMLMALLPWAVLGVVGAIRGSTRAALGAGVVLGVATLAQPSLQLLIVLPVLWIPWAGPAKARYAGRCLVLIVAALAVLAPWVYRNQALFDGKLLIGSNGGSVLYRANNDLATGAFIPKGVVDVEALDELSADREGKRLAVEWIVGHPTRFLQLTAGRALLFAGDDSSGAFTALRRGRPDLQETAAGRSIYLVVKVTTLLPWFMLWIAVAMLTPGSAAAFAGRIDAVLLFVPYIYLAAIHSLFESGGKYHLPATSCLLVGFVWLVASHDKGPSPIPRSK